MTTEEVAALVVGSEVVFESGGYGGAKQIVTVTRRTASQVVLSNGERVNKHGRIVGAGTWSRSYVSACSPEKAQEIRTEARRLRLANALADVRWRELALEKLERIHVALVAE